MHISLVQKWVADLSVVVPPTLIGQEKKALLLVWFGDNKNILKTAPFLSSEGAYVYFEMKWDFLKTDDVIYLSYH